MHASSFLLTAKATGADSSNTHYSGVVLDMDMAGLAYTRLPSVGGGAPSSSYGAWGVTSLGVGYRHRFHDLGGR